MNCSFHTEEEMREHELERVKTEAYRAVLGDGLNRAERRTAKGRLLVAEAEAAALRAENAFLREELHRATGQVSQLTWETVLPVRPDSPYRKGF